MIDDGQQYKGLYFSLNFLRKSLAKLFKRKNNMYSKRKLHFIVVLQRKCTKDNSLSDRIFKQLDHITYLETVTGLVLKKIQTKGSF